MKRSLVDLILYGLFTFASLIALVSSVVTLIGSNGESLASQIATILVFALLLLACGVKLVRGILRLKAEGTPKSE
jgi:hypothetical protein